MDRSQVLRLVKTEYREDSIGQQIPVETKREVFCSVSGVSRDEWLAAGREGMKARYKAVVFAPEYEGESVAELDDKRYSIYRTYPGKHERMELYLEEKAGV